MVAFTALKLFIIGLLNFIKLPVKWDKLACGATLLVFFATIVEFADQMLGLSEHTFSFLWNSSPSGDIKIDIISNTYNCELFFPFLLIGFLAIGANYCFRFEEKRCKYNALILLNLSTLLLMITSNNFVQLLAALFLTDIFAVASANNINTCRRFIIINLLADMLIFMILALINGRIASLDIREVINYKNLGYHIDFITIIGFTAILMKMGFFPFQASLLSLKELRTHRLQNILCLFSPISALILLLKFNTLWLSSAYFLPYFDFICSLTIVWGAIRSVIDDNFRAKIVYWQIMFYALLLELLRFHGFVWDWRIVDLLLADYLLLCGIYLFYYYAGRKSLLSDIIGLEYENRKGLLLAFSVVSLAILALINLLEMIYNNRNRYYIWTYAVLFLLSFCGVLHQILFAEKIKNLSSCKVKTKPHQPLFILLLAIVSLLLLVQLNWNSTVFWIMFGAFIVLVLSGLSSKFSKFYLYKPLQELDFFKSLYDNIFIKILQTTGRLLWLLIDWKLAEKIIIGTALGIWQAGLRFFRKIQNNIFWRILFILLTLSVVIYLSPYFNEVRQ